MERSGFGTIRRERSGRYQARLRVRGRQFGIGTFTTRREAAQALGRFAASYETRTPLDLAPAIGSYSSTTFCRSLAGWRSGTSAQQTFGNRAVGEATLTVERPASLYDPGPVARLRGRYRCDRREPRGGYAFRESAASRCAFSPRSSSKCWPTQSPSDTGRWCSR